MIAALAMAALALPPGLYVRTDAPVTADWSRELWWVDDDRVVVARQEKRSLPGDVATGCEARAAAGLERMEAGLRTYSVAVRGGVILVEAGLDARCGVEVPAGDWVVSQVGRSWRLEGPVRVTLEPQASAEPDWSAR
jgi:hypothetical protein